MFHNMHLKRAEILHPTVDFGAHCIAGKQERNALR